MGAQEGSDKCKGCKRWAQCGRGGIRVLEHNRGVQ